MKFLIAGAGAMGAYMGAKMARAGEDVTLFARGPHLQAMQERGVRVVSADEEFHSAAQDHRQPGAGRRFRCRFPGREGAQPHATGAAVAPLIGPETTVVSTQNGIPWWYFQGAGGEFEGLRLERVDPGGVIASPSRRSRSSAPSSISPRISPSPASFATPKATASRSASPMARARSAPAKSRKR